MVIGDAKEFGNAIRERRKALNYTQASVQALSQIWRMVNLRQNLAKPSILQIFWDWIVP